MDHCTCDWSGPWSARADALFDVAGTHVPTVDALSHDDTTVSALARGGGTSTCGTLPARAGPAGDRDGRSHLTRDQHGCPRARLLDVVTGRSGTAYARWLHDQPDQFSQGVE